MQLVAFKLDVRHDDMKDVAYSGVEKNPQILELYTHKCIW
jgi:hypothetical protein